MDLGVFWRSLRQRWYLVLALVALTAAATFLVAHRVGPTYEGTGTVLVFPPSETQGPTGDTTKENPYLTLAGVTQARDVLVRALTAKNVSDEFGKKYPGTSFEVVPDYTNSAPIILFTVEAETTEDSVAALEMLMDRVPGELSKLQAGLDFPPGERVTSMALTTDERPTVKHKAQIRAAILVAAVLGGAGLLVIALVDGLLAGRRRTREPDEAPREAVPDDAERPDDEPVEWTLPASPPNKVSHPAPGEVETAATDAHPPSDFTGDHAPDATADSEPAGAQPGTDEEITEPSHQTEDGAPAAATSGAAAATDPPEAAKAVEPTPEAGREAPLDSSTPTGDTPSRRTRKRTRRRASGQRPQAGPRGPAPVRESDHVDPPSAGEPPGTGGAPDVAADEPWPDTTTPAEGQQSPDTATGTATDEPVTRTRETARRRPPTELRDGKPSEAHTNTPIAKRSPAGVGGESL